MTDIRDRRIYRWGHGLAPVSEREWQARRSDILEIMEALRSPTTPEQTNELESALRRMSSVFGSIARQSSRDWFITSGLMSHPSPRLARRIGSGLAKLQGELDVDDIQGINAALDSLEAAYVPQIFGTYLATTQPINPGEPSRKNGWAYLLSSTSEPTMLLAGHTDGTLEDVIADTGRANPGMAAFGIAAAWRVTEPGLAHRMIIREIGHRHVANGYHIFAEGREFHEVRQGLDTMLTDRGIVVGNPFWEPNEIRPVLATDPYAQDVRNRKFKVDLDGVFAAFRG